MTNPPQFHAIFEKSARLHIELGQTIRNKESPFLAKWIQKVAAPAAQIGTRKQPDRELDPNQSQWRGGSASFGSRTQGKLMQLRSSGFADGAAIPRRFTCDGEDISPPLAWTEAPTATRGFALFCSDPDAPTGTWHHWAAYDIPVDQTILAEGAAADASAAGFKQAINDFGKSGYGGPCPPRRHGLHHYHFRVLALAVDRLPLRAPHPSCRDVEAQADQHVLAEATLVGTYQR